MEPQSEEVQDSQSQKTRPADANDSQHDPRARKKQRVTQLEGEVQTLLANQDDERIARLCEQLDQERDDGKAIADSLANIQKVLQNIFASGKKAFDEHEAQTSKTRSSKSKSRATDMDAHSSSNSANLLDPGISAVYQSEDADVKYNTPALLQVSLDPASSDSLVELRKYLAATKARMPSAWEVINIALRNAIFMLSQQPTLDTSQDMDIAIRAILHGWAEVESHHCLDIGWILLRELDQYLFFKCPPVTRVAALRMLRLRLLISTSRCAELVPPYVDTTLALSAPAPASSTTSHILPKPPAIPIDFFVWPTLRSYLLRGPALYDPDKFCQMYSKCLRYYWPEAVNDICSTCTTTGCYLFSDLFNARFQELRSWSLSVDFFLEYPDVIGVVPTFSLREHSSMLHRGALVV